MAMAVDLSPSSYQHYEDKFKRKYMPYDLVAKLADALSAQGVLREDVLELAGPQSGFSEPPDNEILNNLYPRDASAKNSPNDPPGTMKFAIVENMVQVAATVDRDGIDELIRRLKKIKDVID